ncbi:hypothetical protein [Bradyrhizobium acaciae]|uniref:hypothetical protein n=1 Tax=Bradyrhizobium acaciae TaxID=2683706 RepID=UPI001E2EDE47|nr:hypothetical protein [Bradyrhizobium acaciae]MCC8978703.1 hypothetical protein [Bradyrhizobium acaciae]
MLKRGVAEQWTVLAAVGEVAVTGLILFIRPQLFARLVFGTEFSEAGDALGRLTAIALLGLVLASWPGPAAAASSISALLIYNLSAAIFLLYVGFGGRLTGLLLWPAVALHAIFTLLLGRAWLTANLR